MKKKRESAYVSTNVPSLRPLYRISHGLAMPKRRRFYTQQGGTVPKTFRPGRKKNNKTIHTLGEWGVDIQIFFWANQLVGGKGALFYRIRDYPLTLVGAAHVAGATIHAPVPLALPLQRMKSSPPLLPRLRKGEISIKKKEKK